MKATQKSTGTVVAIKLILDAFNGVYNCRKLFREIFLLRKLNEMPQNIYTPKLIDVIFNEGAVTTHKSDEGPYELNYSDESPSIGKNNTAEVRFNDR